MALFQRHAHDAHLIIQVLSGGVSVAAADLSGDKPRILMSDHRELAAGARSIEQSATQIPTLASELCTNFLSAYGKSEFVKRKIRGIEIHLGAAFSDAMTLTQTTALGDTKTITDALIAEAAKKALETLPRTDRTILESNVIRVQVNGYPTAKPVGKQGRSFAVTVFRSTVDEQFRKRLDDAIRAVLPGHTPNYRSFARDLMFVLKEHRQDPFHLVIAIEDGASHCVSLRADEIAAYATLPIGTANVLSLMAGEGSPEETRTLVRLAAKDACSTPACDAIRAKLATVEPTIVKSFGDGFAALSSVYRLPNSCLLLAPADLSPWLEGVFARLDFAQFTVTSQPLDVHQFHEALRGVVGQERGGADAWLETATVASALYTKTT